MTPADTYTDAMARPTQKPEIVELEVEEVVVSVPDAHLWYRVDEETDACERCDATRPHETITDAPRRGTEELTAHALETGQYEESNRALLERMAAGARAPSA